MFCIALSNGDDPQECPHSPVSVPFPLRNGLALDIHFHMFKSYSLSRSLFLYLSNLEEEVDWIDADVSSKALWVCDISPMRVSAYESSCVPHKDPQLHFQADFPLMGWEPRAGHCILTLCDTVHPPGGHIAGSLAVVTDAAHLLIDLTSFLLSLFSLWLSSKPPSKRLTFGWYRAGTVQSETTCYRAPLKGGGQNSGVCLTTDSQSVPRPRWLLEPTSRVELQIRVRHKGTPKWANVLYSGGTLNAILSLSVNVNVTFYVSFPHGCS